MYVSFAESILQIGSNLLKRIPIYGFWLVNNDVCSAACCPGQLASAGASDSIPYKTLLKMSVKCLSFFPHVIPSVLFNNGRVKPSFRDRDRHRDRHTHRDGQRMEEDTGSMKQRRPTWTRS